MEGSKIAPVGSACKITGSVDLEPLWKPAQFTAGASNQRSVGAAPVFFFFFCLLRFAKTLHCISNEVLNGQTRLPLRHSAEAPAPFPAGQKVTVSRLQSTSNVLRTQAPAVRGSGLSGKTLRSTMGYMVYIIKIKNIYIVYINILAVPVYTIPLRPPSRLVIQSTPKPIQLLQLFYGP